MDNNIYVSRITEFIRLLREQGFSLGVKDAEDCCTALEITGFEDRELVKTALSAICAKSPAELSAFGRAFDAFFVSREQKLADLKNAMKKQQEEEARRRAAEEELRENEQVLKPDEEMIEGFSALPEEEKERLRRFMERFKDTTDRNPKLYEGFIRSVFMKSIMEQQLLMEDSELGVMEADPELRLLFQDITKINDAQMPRTIALIQKLTKQINGEISARKKSSAKGSALDFKKTIRKGLETGGRLIRLEYKKRRKKRKRLIMLCDVSGSMIQFSEFALRFIKSLSDVSESSRVYIFSEGIAEIDRFSLQNMDQFVQYVRTTGLYGKGTDLSSALEHLLSQKPSVLGQSATLMILSDAKTVKLENAAKSLLKARQLSGDIVWLNPIPYAKWSRLKSVQTMSSICKMVPCSTLEELARECRKLALG